MCTFKVHFIIHAQITQYNTHGLTRAQIPLSFEESKMAARDSQQTIHIDLLRQGCAVAEPGGPWCLQTFALGQLENLTFFVLIICRAP